MHIKSIVHCLKRALHNTSITRAFALLVTSSKSPHFKSIIQVESKGAPSDFYIAERIEYTFSYFERVSIVGLEERIHFVWMVLAQRITDQTSIIFLDDLCHKVFHVLP